MNDKMLMLAVKQTFPATHGLKRNKFVEQQYYSRFYCTKNDELICLHDCDAEEVVAVFKQAVSNYDLAVDDVHQFLNLKVAIDSLSARVFPIAELSAGGFLTKIGSRKEQRNVIQQLMDCSRQQLSFQKLVTLVRTIRRDYINHKYGGVDPFLNHEWHKIYILHICWHLLSKQTSKELKNLIPQPLLVMLEKSMSLHRELVEKQRCAKSCLSDERGRVFARKLKLYGANISDGVAQAKYFADLVLESLKPASDNSDFLDYDEYYDLEYLEDEYD